jgi:cytochrome oxidase assembly protein ShyY1
MAAGVFANALFAMPGSLATLAITNTHLDPAVAFYGVSAGMLAIAALMLHRRRTLPEGLYDEMLSRAPAE